LKTVQILFGFVCIQVEVKTVRTIEIKLKQNWNKTFSKLFFSAKTKR